MRLQELKDKNASGTFTDADALEAHSLLEDRGALGESSFDKSATTQTTLLEGAKEYTGTELNFVFNKTKADLPGDFAQDLEPAGRYMQVSKDTFPGGEGMTTGKVTFKNPLVVEFKSTGRDGWKADLSNQYDGKTGRKLSQAIIKDGYDGIITLRDYGKGLEPVEAVNLQTFR